MMARGTLPLRLARHQAGMGSLLAGLTGQAALVVSGVLVARALGVDDRGHLALMVVMGISLSTLGGLGVPVATTYEIARSPGAAPAVIRLVLPLTLRRSAVLLLVQAGLLYAVFREDDPAVQWAAAITWPTVVASLWQQLGLALLQGQQLYAPFNVLRTMPFVLYASGLVVVAVLDGGIVAAAAVWSTSLVVTAAVTLRRAVVAGRTRPATAAVERRRFLRFGRRALLGSAFPVETFQLDQIVVGLALGPGALGLYVVGTAFMNLPRFLGQSVGMLAYPRIAAQPDARLGRRALMRYTAIVAALCGTVVAVLEATVGWLVPLFFGDAFAGAVPIARILLIAALFIALRRVLAESVRGLGHAGLGSLAELTSWLVLVPALVVQGDDPEGVALAVTVAYAASVIVLAIGTFMRTRPGSSPPAPPPAPHPVAVEAIGE